MPGLSREHQQAAGRARWRQIVTAIILENPTSPERAAERLSCLRRNWGFAYRTGLTAKYIRDLARQLGLSVYTEGTNQ